VSMHATSNRLTNSTVTPVIEKAIVPCMHRRHKIDGGRLTSDIFPAPSSTADRHELQKMQLLRANRSM